MSAGSNLRSEDQFLCSICLDLFTDPVSTSCGHNFCKTCISQHWDNNVLYDCPLCKERFPSRPRLRVNTFIKEMVDQFRRNPEETVVRAVPQLDEDLIQPTMMSEAELKSIQQLDEDFIQTMMMSEAELKSIQQFEVDLTLDPKTVEHSIMVYDDKIYSGYAWKKLPKNPERFSGFVSLLGNQSFSSGRFYFQVQVIIKTDWTLGVTRGYIKKKGKVKQSPKNGFWAIGLRNGYEYLAFTDPPVPLKLDPGPEKVGVFVDYQEGLVSFYDVDAAALIYSFTGCCFNIEVYPYFGLYPKYGGINSCPLFICPVNQSA